MPRLNEEEISDIKTLVYRYRDLWIQSEDYGKKIEDLTREREILVEEVERLRYEMETAKGEEKILEDKLRNKYGNFSLDMETFEITIIEE